MSYEVTVYDDDTFSVVWEREDGVRETLADREQADHPAARAKKVVAKHRAETRPPEVLSEDVYTDVDVDGWDPEETNRSL